MWVNRVSLSVSHYLIRQNNVYIEPLHIKLQEALVAEYRQSILSDTGISPVEPSEPSMAESAPFPSKDEAIASNQAAMSVLAVACTLKP